ncbi:unnamed protein product [Calypogeia fissa]
MGGRKQVHGYAQTWKMLLEDLRRRFESFLNVHTNVFITDVRRRRKVSGLKTLLLDHSAKLLRDEKVPDMCQKIQGRLSHWSGEKKEFPVLDWETYVKQLRKLIAPQPEAAVIEAATKYLHEVGVLIHIDKKFPPHWEIPYRRLVVLDVNWFCKGIIGNIFLSEDMADRTEHPFLFRRRVDELTGSISISAFKDFFQSRSRWNDDEVENLITILLWLGLCYKGKENQLFIPSLIDKDGKSGDQWQPRSTYEDGGDSWVMGFSIEHKRSEMTLAPMSLWHRFQVQVAQTSRFTEEVLDNDFVAGKYFMTITIDYMYVLIQVDATENIPTFHQISFFVTPGPFRNEGLDPHERKQRQVDLAGNLVELLLGLWDDICGGVEYVHKVVWPWPSSQPRPEHIVDRNVEVAEVKRLVQMHGTGRKMQWTVGNGSEITEDQLLSTTDKQNVLKSVESDTDRMREGMREAVILGIYPAQLIEDSSVALDEIDTVTHPTNTLTEGQSSEESRSISSGIEEASPPMSPTRRIIMAKLKEVQHDVKEVGGKVDQVFEKVNNVEIMVREGFTKVLRKQKEVLRKLQDTERFFQEDKNRMCPNLIYLAEKDSDAWATLKQALSPVAYVRLRFACEAKYNDYKPHEVKGQQGLDVPTVRPLLRKIIPWLKVSLTVLLISAKIGANFVAPGLGLILPNFQQWQQASSLLEGIEWATGFPKAELDRLMIEGMRLDVANPMLWDCRAIYGKSRKAIGGLVLGNMTRKGYEKKLGLKKVSLIYNDGRLHGVVWICTECLRNFKKSKLAIEV